MSTEAIARDYGQKAVFVECDCCSHLLHLDFSRENGHDELCLSMFTRGTGGERFSWRDRLALIWQILRTGYPHYDQFVLMNDGRNNQITKLVEWLKALPLEGK